MTNKGSTNIFNWLSGFFICSISILGFLILKNNSSTEDYTEPDYSVDFRIAPFPGFLPNQKDDSLLRVSFFTPLGMVEDEVAERKSGVYKVFKSDGSKKVHDDSVIIVTFCKKKEVNSNLESFIFEFTKNLKDIFPDAQITFGLLHLHKQVVKKFEDMGMPRQGILFLIDNELKKPVYTSATFFFETPGGYWSIVWGGPRKILKRAGTERNIFLALIKYLTIEIINGNTLEVHM